MIVIAQCRYPSQLVGDLADLSLRCVGVIGIKTFAAQLQQPVAAVKHHRRGDAIGIGGRLHLPCGVVCISQRLTERLIHAAQQPLLIVEIGVAILCSRLRAVDAGQLSQHHMTAAVTAVGVIAIVGTALRACGKIDPGGADPAQITVIGVAGFTLSILIDHRNAIGVVEIADDNEALSGRTRHLRDPGDAPRVVVLKPGAITAFITLPDHLPAVVIGSLPGRPPGGISMLQNPVVARIRDEGLGFDDGVGVHLPGVLDGAHRRTTTVAGLRIAVVVAAPIPAGVAADTHRFSVIQRALPPGDAQHRFIQVVVYAAQQVLFVTFFIDQQIGVIPAVVIGINDLYEVAVVVIAVAPLAAGLIGHQVDKAPFVVSELQ